MMPLGFATDFRATFCQRFINFHIEIGLLNLDYQSPLALEYSSRPSAIFYVFG